MQERYDKFLKRKKKMAQKKLDESKGLSDVEIAGGAAALGAGEMVRRAVKTPEYKSPLPEGIRGDHYVSKKPLKDHPAMPDRKPLKRLEVPKSDSSFWAERKLPALPPS